MLSLNEALDYRGSGGTHFDDFWNIIDAVFLGVIHIAMAMRCAVITGFGACGPAYILLTGSLAAQVPIRRDVAKVTAISVAESGCASLLLSGLCTVRQTLVSDRDCLVPDAPAVVDLQYSEHEQKASLHIFSSAHSALVWHPRFSPQAALCRLSGTCRRLPPHHVVQPASPHIFVRAQAKPRVQAVIAIFHELKVQPISI